MGSVPSWRAAERSESEGAEEGEAQAWEEAGGEESRRAVEEVAELVDDAADVELVVFSSSSCLTPTDSTPPSALPSSLAAYSGLSPPAPSATSPTAIPTLSNHPSRPPSTFFLALRIRRLDWAVWTREREARKAIERGQMRGRREITKRALGRETG